MKNIFSFNRKKKESKEIVINKVAILFNLESCEFINGCYLRHASVRRQVFRWH